MQKFVIFFTTVLFVAVGLLLYAEYFGTTWQMFGYKLVAMSAIIFLAIYKARLSFGFYRYAVILGLCFSLCGDLLLVFPEYFLYGLIVFLVAHLWYTVAFIKEKPFQLKWKPLLVAAAYGSAVYIFLWSSLANFKIPVLIYLIVILIMGWQAHDRWLQNHQFSSKLAFWGAILFIISDTILAINKFHTPFLLARVLSLSTYFGAQYFIALSIDIRSSMFYPKPTIDTDSLEDSEPEES